MRISGLPGCSAALPKPAAPPASRAAWRPAWPAPAAARSPPRSRRRPRPRRHRRRRRRRPAGRPSAASWCCCCRGWRSPHCRSSCAPGRRPAPDRSRAAACRRRHMQRLAVGEQRDQLPAAHLGPVADIADVEMHEGRSGRRIVADAAALHLEADLAQPLQLDVGDVEIHRLAEHVLALLGDALAAAAQHRIGLRRAVAADDVDVVVRRRRSCRLPRSGRTAADPSWSARCAASRAGTGSAGAGRLESKRPLRLKTISAFSRVCMLIELERARVGAGAGRAEQREPEGKHRRGNASPPDGPGFSAVRLLVVRSCSNQKALLAAILSPDLTSGCDSSRPTIDPNG